MNDQVDGKSLLGSYSCNEIPGQFTWTNGVITKAVLNGDWLLIEDVDQAPPDVLSALEPLIQKRELHILSRGMVLRAHPGKIRSSSIGFSRDRYSVDSFIRISQPSTDLVTLPTQICLLHIISVGLSNYSVISMFKNHHATF